MKIVCWCLLFLISFCVRSQDHVKAAKDFHASLKDEQRKKLQYSYRDNERFNWNFVPTSRNGLSLHELTPAQKELALKLLSESLSAQGYKKATGIIALEGILREVEGRSSDDTYRDPLNYFITFFGNPSGNEIWGWRIEGHHLALNFSSVDGIIVSSTPTFMGANPGVVPTGDAKGRKTLRDETDLAFSLINSLDGGQKTKAIFSDKALPEIVSGNSRKANALEPKGILYTDLNEDQKKIFLNLLNVFVKNYEFGFSKKLMAKIEKAGIENLSFAWAGGLSAGTGHYYRIQGPMLLIEYDNIQTNANHVHTAVRDLTNDFAEDILKEHYKKEHNEK